MPIKGREDLYNYTYLSANKYLDKFRNALGMPNLTLSYLVALLKTFNNRLGLKGFIVPNRDGKLCLYYKQTLNKILGMSDDGHFYTKPEQNPNLQMLNDIIEYWERKNEPSVEDLDSSNLYDNDEEDMQKMSDRLSNLEESKKKIVKNDEGETVPETCPDCGGKIGVYIQGEPVYLCSKCKKYFGTMPFNLKEAKKIRKVYITESQYRSMLLENEGTNMKRARKYLESKRYSPEQRQQILDNIRTDIPNSRLQQCKFLLGVTRLYIEGQLQDGHSISELNKTLKYIASDAHVNEYDFNLNGESLDTLVQRFSGVAKADLEQSKAASNARQLTVNNNYTIVPIGSYKEARKYGKYTSWCVTHYKDAYDSYTANGAGRFYFCLRQGFESVPKVEGENCPLDEYGLSMVAVSVTMEGELNTVTCRWNHDNGGSDNVMTLEQLEDLLGRNFYQTFKPYSREELHAKGVVLFDEVQGLLDSGKSPEEIFNDVCHLPNGFANVKLNGKYNFIDTEGQLLSSQWFDEAYNFLNGFAAVRLNGKWNFINAEGQILSNQWFDVTFPFSKGFARVILNDKWNFINAEGQLISNQGFDAARKFLDGFAKVNLNGKWYYLDTQGNLHYSPPVKQAMEESKKGRKIYVSESQMKKIKQYISESYFVEPKKVKIVEDFLDKTFVRGAVPTIGEDGYAKQVPIVAMNIPGSEEKKNMTATQAFYLLQDKFNKVYSEPKQRDDFLKKVLIDWYYKRISKDGLLSKNNY